MWFEYGYDFLFGELLTISAVLFTAPLLSSTSPYGLVLENRFPVFSNTFFQHPTHIRLPYRSHSIEKMKSLSAVSLHHFLLSYLPCYPCEYPVSPSWPDNKLLLFRPMRSSEASFCSRSGAAHDVAIGMDVSKMPCPMIFHWSGKKKQKKKKTLNSSPAQSNDKPNASPNSNFFVINSAVLGTYSQIGS
ncbi:hypothetical protein QR685DRAFT_527508 [Neurospora intermedia]|uniref:Uncharacterized protein n=1 Tax=Neurospora intermedia TaxID=5142 RepID=A0ABR3DAQ1_NEUIN